MIAHHLGQGHLMTGSALSPQGFKHSDHGVAASVLGSVYDTRLKTEGRPARAQTHHPEL
jgi:hypothetical protein